MFSNLLWNENIESGKNENDEYKNPLKMFPFLIVSGERHLAPGERRLQLLEVPVDDALVDVFDLFLQGEIDTLIILSNSWYVPKYIQANKDNKVRLFG